jgi:hypothetical protein
MYVPAAAAVIVQVAVAESALAPVIAVVDVHAVTPALPATVHVIAPVGTLLPEPVMVAVKTMLPPRTVGELSVTTLVGTVVAPAIPAMPNVSPDAIKAPSARYRVKVRRTPPREFLKLLIVTP